ncbi:MAG TPA: peptide deformylase [Rhabdochlamydiaceae bacterium]|jgi:peptide deformylase
MSIFLTPADPLLRARASEVPVHEIPTAPVQALLEKMYELSGGERVDPSKRSLVGLAAPQIGFSKRIILVDVGIRTDRRTFGELRAYINPVIVWHSDDMLWDCEGCFSVDRRIRGIVPRYASIRLIAYDRNGNPIEEEHHGYTARIFQHEIDHLEGIRFPERVGEEGTLHWVEEAEILEYRKDYFNWHKRCPWEIWTHVKEGTSFCCPHS